MLYTSEYKWAHVQYVKLLTECKVCDGILLHYQSD